MRTKTKKRVLKTLLASVLLLGGIVTASCGEENTGSTTTVTSALTTTTTTPERVELTVAEALALIPSDNTSYVSTERYYIRATIDKVSNPTYGEMTVSDSTGSIYVYGTYDSTGEKRYSEMESKPVKGDEVLLYAILQNHNGTKEIKSGWIIEFSKGKVDVDLTKYQSSTIAEAREAKVGSLIRTTGVVSAITYATGVVPSGFYLTDSKATIYVYSDQVAQQVEVGNTIEIAGEKDYYILSTEQTNAAKYNYKGSNQLTNAVLISNDKAKSSFSTDGALDLTVKQALASDFSEDVTSKLICSKAIINRVEGKGFTNYYINDLDNKTGSYVYTQCNGSDFSWLDTYDGKIVTVYYTLANAKATATGCVWRLIPVKVSLDEYSFDLSTTPDFVYEYYVKDNFKSEYTGDPVLELPVSVSSSILNFENATISYTSSNPDAIYFEEVKDGVVMHTLHEGTSTITVTVSYATYTKEFSFDIKMSAVADVETITVSEAYKAELNTEVTVKGIVAAATVNQSGFYLIDSTGVIAVRLDSKALETLEIGNEVIIKGTITDTKGDKRGQMHLTESTIVSNLYGKHDYSTASFVTDKTLADIASLPNEPESTKNVYTITGTIKFVESQYFSNAYVVSGDTEFLLYTSSGKQYNWLKDYEGQEMTIELAVCNWNGRSLKGNIISVTVNGQKIVNELKVK